MEEELLKNGLISDVLFDIEMQCDQELEKQSMSGMSMPYGNYSNHSTPVHGKPGSSYSTNT